MKLFCDQHREAHHVTEGEAERIVYAMAHAYADECGDPSGVHAGEDCWSLVPCPLEVLRWSWDSEMYSEAVEGSVEARLRSAQPSSVGSAA